MIDQAKASAIANVFFDKRNIHKTLSQAQRLSLLFGSRVKSSREYRHLSVTEACTIVQQAGYTPQDTARMSKTLDALMRRELVSLLAYDALIGEGRMSPHGVDFVPTVYLGMKVQLHGFDLTKEPDLVSDMKRKFIVALQKDFAPKTTAPALVA